MSARMCQWIAARLQCISNVVTIALGWAINVCLSWFNTLKPRQNGRHFADNILKCIFLNENLSISIQVSLKFVPRCPIHNFPALVQIMAWRRPGNKPLSEPMVISLLTNIYASLSLNGLNFKIVVLWKIWLYFYVGNFQTHLVLMYWMFPVRSWPVGLQDPVENRLTLVQVVIWCHPTTTDYLSQC